MSNFKVLDRVYVSKSGYWDYNNRSWTGYGVVSHVNDSSVYLTKVTPPIPGLENSDEIPVPFYFDTDCFEVVGIKVGNWVQVNKSVFQNLDGSMWKGIGQVCGFQGSLVILHKTNPPVPPESKSDWSFHSEDLTLISGR